MPTAKLSPGQRAPAFTLPSTRGSRTRLTELRGRWVIVFFYPKDHTPGCTEQACDFRDLHADFRDAQAVILGVSPDDLDCHDRFTADYRLPFELLTDRDSRVASKYGAWREKRQNGRSYMGMVRSTFLIDPSGKVARVFNNVRARGHAAKVLDALVEERAR